MKCSSCSADLSPRATFCVGCGARVEDPFLGTTLNNRYRVEAKIAVGGFGAIYRATQLTNGRNVAIKVMHRELGADENLVARFRREGVVLCSLRDAHTVTTYELDETPDGRLFIVMELLAGKNLLDVFRAKGRLPWTRMFTIARSICSALAEAHALGIVHRDLKPANIYLEARHEGADFVKVLDFGIAKVMQESGISDGSELTRMGQAVGTVEYMAPEQLMAGKCDGRTDIYTVGVVVFEMITGNRPFSAVGLDLLTVQLSQKPPLASAFATVPDAVDRLILRCLEADVSDRFADVSELAHAIDEVLASEAAIQPAWTDSAAFPRVTQDEPPQALSDDTVRQPYRPTAPRVNVPSSAELRASPPADVPDSPRIADTTEPQLAIPADPPRRIEATTDTQLTVPTDPRVTVPTDPQVTVPTDPQVTVPTDPQVTVPTAPPVAAPIVRAPNIPKPRQLEVPFVQTVVPREKPPRTVNPLAVLVVLLVIGLGLGAAIAWLF